MGAPDFVGLVLLVLVYTIVFDVLDLHPQIGSFRFLRSVTYSFYLVYRAGLGLLASLALDAVLDSPPDFYLLALIGTLSGVTILQNFALNVAGTDVANVAELGNKYRARMVEEENERQSLRKSAHSLALQQKLGKLPIDLLEAELRRMFLGVGYPPDEAKGQVEILKEATDGDDGLYSAVLASTIATINPDFAEQLIAVSVQATQREPLTT